VALAARYGRWRSRPARAPATPDGVHPELGAAIISRQLAAGGEWLDADRVAELLRCYGLPQVTAEPDTDGVELIVGVVADPNFGPVLACGAGGPHAALMRDVAVRITPLQDGDAHDMIRSLRTFPLLDGYRGAEPADVAAVEDVLARVSAMVDAHPEIVELDCDRLVVSPDGVTIKDFRIRVAAAPPPAPVPSLEAY
jgi:acyl-CoA synthetase (NDP forming)